MKKIILTLLALSAILFGENLTTKNNQIILLLEGKIELNTKTCNDISPENVENLITVLGEKDADNKLKELCAVGCGEACGRTVKGNYLNKKEFEKACNSKFPYGYACYTLSYNEKDEEKKFELQDKGCKAGHSTGCYWMAGHFETDKNYGLALKYYNIGCDMGDDQSCGELGMVYATGKYGETNPQKAYEYWNKSVQLNPNNVSKGNLKILCRDNPSVCK